MFSFRNFLSFRYSDGSVKLRNPNIELMDQDILYHLALGSGSHDLQEMFGDVKVRIVQYLTILLKFLQMLIEMYCSSS